MPIDIVARIIRAEEWQILNKGLKQRITALNLFIDDMYNKQKILKDGVVPWDLIESGKCFLRPCWG